MRAKLLCKQRSLDLLPSFLCTRDFSINISNNWLVRMDDVLRFLCYVTNITKIVLDLYNDN